MAVKLSDLIKSYEDNNISGEFSTWISKLELVAKLQKVEDLKTFVPLFLNGSAFALYEQLSEDVKGDYAKLKKELLTAFSINIYCAYSQLRERALQDSETVDVYLADLRRLVESMGQTNPEPLLKCAFVSGLPSDVACQLKATAAVEEMGLSEIVTRARAILSTNSGASSYVCSASTRDTRSQPAKGVQCYACSGFGHISRECPTGRKTKTTSSSKPTRCYSCNNIGHISRNCTVKEPQGNENGGASASHALPNNQH